MFMIRYNFIDIKDFTDMLVSREYDEISSLSVICHYDVASALIEELIRTDLTIGSIDIGSASMTGYGKEYIITILDGCIYCECAYGVKDNGFPEDRYLSLCSDVVYIHGACNSKILKYIECKQIYEFAISDMDDDFEFDGDDLTEYHSESSTITKSKDGDVTGFTKSWSTNTDGVFQYSSYSYHCDNANMVRNMAEKFDIEL